MRLRRQFIATVVVGVAAILAFFALVRVRELPVAPARLLSQTPSNSSAPTAGANLSPPAKEAIAPLQNPPEESDSKKEWSRLAAQPATPERDAALAAAFKRLTTTGADVAAAQLLALSPADRVSVVATLLAEAAGRSADEAVRETIRFCDEDPSYSLEYGRSLISVLAKTGDYRAALDFIMAEESNGWLGENGHKWLTNLFTTWGNAKPEQAAAAVMDAVSPGMRGEALQTLAAAWVKTDPLAAANFAWQLPASSDRNLMLDVTLHHWSDTNPAAAATWLDGKKRE